LCRASLKSVGWVGTVNSHCEICGDEYKRRGNKRTCGDPECEAIQEYLHQYQYGGTPCAVCGLRWNKELEPGKKCPKCLGDKDWPKMRRRSCLKCDTEYLSLELTDRLCPICRVRNRFLSSGSMETIQEYGESSESAPSDPY
jgi:hypothetical protein